MSDESTSTNRPGIRLSLDVWAVITAFLLAAVVRAGVIKHIPW